METPSELGARYEFVEMLQIMLQHPISKGIIEWAKDGMSFNVLNDSEAIVLFQYCGIQGMTKKAFQQYFDRYFGFRKVSNNYKHPLFIQSQPTLAQRMRRQESKAKAEVCQECGVRRKLVVSIKFCPMCVEHDPQFIPLGDYIDEDNKKNIFAEIDIEKNKKQQWLNDGVITDNAYSVSNVKMMNPGEALELKEMQEVFGEGGFLDTYNKRVSSLDYDSLDDICLRSCGRTRDE